VTGEECPPPPPLPRMPISALTHRAYGRREEGVEEIWRKGEVEAEIQVAAGGGDKLGRQAGARSRVL